MMNRCLLAILVGLVLALAACAPTPTPSPTATPQATAPATVRPAPTATATPSVTPTPTPRPRTIFLDAGHGGKDPGAVHLGSDGNADLVEKDLNLDVARRLGALLSANGYAVVYSRSTDVLATTFSGSSDRENRRAEVQARVDAANSARADLFISIHHNGFGDAGASGTEVYYCADRPFADKSKRLAQLTLDAILKELRGIGYQAVNRGIHDDYGVLREGYHYFALGPTSLRPSEMPGILGEALFVTNDAEAALLNQDAARQAIARGYYQAIVAYFQPTPTVTATATQAPRALATPTVNGGTGPRPTVPPELARGNTTRPQMALTFDAGASSEPTTAILDALRTADVHATMFLTGQWIKENPALVKRIVADGHEAANHTFTHPDLRTIADGQIQQELTTTARLFKDTTGLDMAPYFRPPFGSRDARVLQVAWKAGYRAVYWTVDSGDWREDATPAAVQEKVLGSAENGAIVVMHLGSVHTPQVLPQIIAALRRAGYSLVKISQLE